MTPRKNPWTHVSWNRPGFLTDIRAQVLAYAYPSGLPTDGCTVTENYTEQGASPAPPPIVTPTGCSRVDLYTITNPGGRVGSPHYQWLLHPTVAFSGVNLMWCNGYMDFDTEGDTWDTYYVTPGSSVILAALTLGWRVLVSDQPTTGYNPGSPGNPVAATTTYEGTLKEIANGTLWKLDYDGGPSLVRMFSDSTIRGANQLATDYGEPTKWVMGAHCGGVGGSGFTLCVDERFTRVAQLRALPPLRVANVFQENNARTQFINALYYTGPNAIIDYGGVMSAAAALAGRKTMISNAEGDTVMPLNHWGEWRNWWYNMQTIVARYGAELWPKEYTGLGHPPMKEEVEFAMALLQS